MALSLVRLIIRVNVWVYFLSDRQFVKTKRGHHSAGGLSTRDD